MAVKEIHNHEWMDGWLDEALFGWTEGSAANDVLTDILINVDQSNG